MLEKGESIWALEQMILLIPATRMPLAEARQLIRLKIANLIDITLLNRHVSTIHVKDKPFLCHHCNFTTNRRDKIKQHMAAMHSELNPENFSYRQPMKSTPEVNPQTFSYHSPIPPSQNVTECLTID